MDIPESDEALLAATEDAGWGDEDFAALMRLLEQ